VGGSDQADDDFACRVDVEKALRSALPGLARVKLLPSGREGCCIGRKRVCRIRGRVDAFKCWEKCCHLFDCGVDGVTCSCYDPNGRFVELQYFRCLNDIMNGAVVARRAAAVSSASCNSILLQRSFRSNAPADIFRNLFCSSAVGSFHQSSKLTGWNPFSLQVLTCLGLI
jgi:hypothetical protein